MKTEQGSDNQTLRPQEYLPLIKYLDKGGQGIVEVKDLILLLEKYSSSNTSDFTLELKYMANYIEYRMKNRYTT